MNTILLTLGGLAIVSVGVFVFKQSQDTEARRILMDEYTALLYYSHLFEKGDFSEKEFQRMKDSLSREPLHRSKDSIEGIFVPKSKVSAYHESKELLSAMKTSSFERLKGNRALYQPKVEEMKNKLLSLLN